MKAIVLAALLFGGMLAAAQSADPAGYHYWSHDELAKMTSALAPQMENNLKSVTIVKETNHRFIVSHREGAGEAEYHETEEDIVYVQSGHATLIYGGKMIGGKVTAPGELRGEGIEGGLKQELGPGDVAVVPVKTPHQFMPWPGEGFNYFVVKVTIPAAGAQ